MKYTWKTTGIGKVDHLGIQFQKVLRGINEYSYSSKYRYASAGRRFIIHTGKKFGLAKIQNIQDKHLEDHARELKEQGKSNKYIKTELSAIRAIHANIPQAKYELTESLDFNKNVVGLGSTPDGRADRAWTEHEIKEMKNIAIELNRPEISNVIELMRSTGMRLDEAVTIRRDQLESAMKTGKIHLTNTKGNVPRDIPLNDRAKALFEKVLPEISRGNYVFVPQKYVKSHTIHKFKVSVQNLIYNHRNKIQDPERSLSAHNLKPYELGPLTAHGLRHTYAREDYKQYRDRGFSKFNAESQTANDMGHTREEVTRIYTLE